MARLLRALAAESTPDVQPRREEIGSAIAQMYAEGSKPSSAGWLLSL